MRLVGRCEADDAAVAAGGLLVPQKLVKRRRIGTGENGIVRRRVTRRYEVWGTDFVQD